MKYTNTKKELAIKIEKAMKNKGFSLKRLAEKSEVSKSYLYRILKGDANPRIDKICKIMHSLGQEVELEFLLKKKKIRSDYVFHTLTRKYIKEYKWE